MTLNRKETILKIREFNRLYMPSMHLLGKCYLGSEFSISEARPFFEIYQNEGCNAAYIAELMNLDKSYLSRILARYEKEGYLRREQSLEDGRSYNLFLTESGKRRAEDFIRKSDADIAEIISGLSDSECEELIEAMCVIQSLLTKRGKRK